MKKQEFIVSLTLLIINAVALVALFIVNMVTSAHWLLIIEIILIIIEVGLILTIRNFYEEYKNSR